MSIRISFGNIAGTILVLGWNLFNRFNPKQHILSIYLHNPKKNVFESTILYLKKKGFRFISTDDLQKLLEQKKSLQGRTAIVTLDDAWRDNLQNVIPTAEKYQIPLTVFVPIQPLEDGALWLKWFRDKELQQKFPEIMQQNPKKLSTAKRNALWSQLKTAKQFEREIMTIDEIKTLAEHPLITLGGHTFTHPILPNCTTEELEFELVTANEKLNEITGISTNVLAYPNGDYNNEVIAMSEKAGFRMAFTTEEGRYIDIEQTNHMLLPRNCVPNAYGSWESKARALGIWQKVFKS